jgi:hypothetical protein
MPRVHATDAREFFGQLTLDKEEHDLIESVCRGNPSRLAQLYRILRVSSSEPRVDLLDLQQQAPNLFEVEWRTVDRSNSTQRFLIAVLAHDRRKYNFDTLAAVTKVATSEIQQLLSHLTFLVIDERTGDIQFASEPHRCYAAEELRSLEPAVNTRIIDSLLESPEADEAIITLPAYFEKTSRHSHLLDYLGGQHVSAVMERTHSLAMVRQRVRLGASTAKRLNRHAELMRFSMHNAVIQEVTGADVWGPEVAGHCHIERIRADAMLNECPTAGIVAIVSPRKSSRTPSGSITASRSAFGTWKRRWLHEGCWSATKPSGAGATSSATCTRKP